MRFVGTEEGVEADRFLIRESFFQSALLRVGGVASKELPNLYRDEMRDETLLNTPLRGFSVINTNNKSLK